jgi:hypothetical protein
MAWSAVSASGTAPSARFAHGFTSAGEMLYIHGGLSNNWGNDINLKVTQRQGHTLLTSTNVTNLWNYFVTTIDKDKFVTTIDKDKENKILQRVHFPLGRFSGL